LDGGDALRLIDDLVEFITQDHFLAFGPQGGA